MNPIGIPVPPSAANFVKVPRFNASNWPARGIRIGKVPSPVGAADVTIQKSAAQAVGQSIAYSPKSNRLICIASGGATVTSIDGGMTWSNGGALPTGQWKQVIYSPLADLFIATNNDGVNTAIATSPDGAAWTARASAGTAAMTWIASGATKIVALLTSTGACMTSSDGITWAAGGNVGTTPFGLVWGSGPGLFVIVGATWYTSPDGTAWTSRSSGVGNFADSYGIAYGNGRYVAWGYNSGVITAQVSYSTDGINWVTEYRNDLYQYATQSGSTGVNCMAFGNGMFYINTRDRLKVSIDGLEWWGNTLHSSDITNGGSNVTNGSIAPNGWGCVACMLNSGGNSNTGTFRITDPNAQDLLYVPQV